MGINAHLLPGDVVAAYAGSLLLRQHPDTDESGTASLLTQDRLCMVLSVAAAGSSGMGHAFFVWVPEMNRVGWLINHAVRPVGTTKEPSP